MLTKILSILAAVLAISTGLFWNLYQGKKAELKEIERRSELAKVQYDSIQKQFDAQNDRIKADFERKQHVLDSISGLQRKQLENYLALSGKKARVYIDSGNALRDKLEKVAESDTAAVRHLKDEIARIDRTTLGYTCIDVQIPREIMTVVGGK